MRGFGKKELRRLFGPKGPEIIGGERKLYFEELHSMFSSLILLRNLE
jgi:hypothetical protein